jgi:hypothetical protein
VGVDAMEESTAGEATTPNREVMRASKVILDILHDTLFFVFSAADRQNVMKKVMTDPFVGANIPKRMRFNRNAVVDEDILRSIRQSRSELRCPRTFVELAIKHPILIAQISFGEATSVRHYARLLKVYPKNISKAVLKRKSMDSEPKIQWILSLRKRRVDVLSSATKNVVLQWWLFETRNSPCRKEVVRKLMPNGEFGVKPMQYLIES